MSVNPVSGMIKIVLSIVIGVVIGSATSLNAFNRHITEDPTKVLHKYLSLDKKGSRLEASSWQVVAPYVDWKEEPAWGHVVVISQFHIVDDVTQWEIVNGLEAKIPVVFDVLGTMHWESVTFVSDPHQETYLFHIKSVYVTFEKPLLANDSDVDQYLQQMRKALLKAISEGKQIQT